MEAGHSKLGGYNATLPAMRPSSQLPTVVAPPPLSPSSLLCAHPYALLLAPTPKPVVQLLVRTATPSSFSHHATASPIVRNRPSEAASRSLCSWAGVHALYGLTPLPNRCPATFSKPPASYHFTHRYAHALRPPPLSPASIAPLAVTSPAPALSWLSEHLPPACRAGKTLLLDAFKLFSMAVSYLHSFR
jgi:hypothetical protein